LAGVAQNMPPLVYGPSAQGRLAQFAESVGGQTLNDLMAQGLKSTEMSVSQFSIQTLNGAAAAGRSIYFDLTYMNDVPGVLNGTAYPSAITSMELNYINANWTQVFQPVVTFFESGVTVGAPW
jgi:hypothetical protein